MRFSTALVFFGVAATLTTNSFSAFWGGGPKSVNRMPYAADSKSMPKVDWNTVNSLQLWATAENTLTDIMSEQLVEYRKRLEDLGNQANTPSLLSINQQVATVIQEISSMINRAKMLWIQSASAATNQISLQLVGDQKKNSISQLVSANAASKQQALELTLDIEGRIRNLEDEIASVERQARSQNNFTSSRSYSVMR